MGCSKLLVSLGLSLLPIRLLAAVSSLENMCVFMHLHVINIQVFHNRLQKSYSDIPEGNFLRTIPKYSEANFHNVVNLVELFRSIANKYGQGVTSGQVALAWLLAQGDDIIPIPGQVVRFSRLPQLTAFATLVERRRLAILKKMSEPFACL
jgi:aryl-alcohol dehydrogenase-like predicted oxidoreductase